MVQRPRARTSGGDVGLDMRGDVARWCAESQRAGGRLSGTDGDGPRLVDAIVHGTDDERGGGIGVEVVGVDHEVVEVRVVDISVEVGADEAATRVVLLVEQVGDLVVAAVLFGGQSRDARLARGDEANVQAAGLVARDEMRGATGEDDVPDVRELEHGFGDFLFQLPEGRMKTNELTDGGTNF